MTHTATPAGEVAVKARGLGRRFGRHWALAHVDLDLPAGQTLLLAGANGSGKTTLLRLFSGLLRPSAGELRLFGRDPARERLWCRRRLSLVSHETYLYDQLTALEMVRLWARLLARPADDEELLALLSRVGLADRRHSAIAGFSAGMRKRLTLLRTQLEAPCLVLLDEPFAALDPPGQAMVEAWLSDFRARGLAVVLASHSLARAAQLADRALLLQDGQIAWHGPAAELLEHCGELQLAPLGAPA